MWKVYSCLLVLFHVFAAMNTTCVLELEAENGDRTNSAKLMYRSAASGGFTVLLTETDDDLDLYFEIVMGSDCLVVINNVAYSNDGEADTVKLSVNGSSLGTFRTYAASNYGHNWNEIRNTGPFGTSIGVTVGTYVLNVKALVVDSYGVEIDKVELAVQCSEILSGNCPETVANVIPVDSGDGDELSTAEIAGIVIGVVGAVIGVPGCVAAILYIIKEG